MNAGFGFLLPKPRPSAWIQNRQVTVNVKFQQRNWENGVLEGVCAKQSRVFVSFYALKQASKHNRGVDNNFV